MTGVATTPDPRAPYFELATIYLVVAGIVFLLVVLALAITSFRDRESRGKSPSSRKASPRLEMGFAVVLGAIAAGLLWQTYTAMGRIDAVRPANATAAAGAAPAAPGAMTVRIVAAKWNWRFEYPGGVVQQGTPGRPAVLVVPASVPIRFELTSTDVAHAFWIPAAKYKYDAYPGRTNVFDMAFAPGVDYANDRCSEFCGEYHALMTFGVDVRPRAAFDAWLRDRRAQVAAR